jgi:hypothetical protein
VDNKRPIKSFTIEKPNGKYHVSTTEDCDRLPDHLDKTILYYLLLQKNKTVSTTRYEISNRIFNSDTSHYYEKIEKAIKRWFSISINFEGVFFTGDGYTKRGFHVIDSYKFEKKDNRGENLVIQINSEFYDQLERTHFFKYVDFNEFHKLKKPISASLYEHLIKQFKGRNTWRISILKLAEKLTINRKYPYDILVKLKPAVNEINKNTNFKFTMDYDEETKRCLFTLLGKDAKSDHITGDSEELTRLLALLPEELKGQRSVKTLLEGYLKEKGYQFAQSNIIYALQNAKKNMKAFLKQALLKDYGEETRAMAVVEEQQRRKNKAIEETRAKKDAEEKELWNQVLGWIKKHGGVEKVLYHGDIVIVCSPSVGGLVIETEDGRKAIPLAEVREEEFSAQRRK